MFSHKYTFINKTNQVIKGIETIWTYVLPFLKLKSLRSVLKYKKIIISIFTNIH